MATITDDGVKTDPQIRLLILPLSFSKSRIVEEANYKSTNVLFADRFSLLIFKTTSPDVCMTSESDMDGEIFDFDFESLGPDFSLSELLHDFGVDCGAASHSCQEAIDASTGPLIQPKNGEDFHISKDLTTRGSDSITSVKSITQCIQIISPGSDCEAESF